VGKSHWIARRIVLQQIVQYGNYVGRFVFRRDASTAGATGAAADYVPVQELLTTAGDSMHVQAQKIAQHGVTAVAHPDRLQPGKQAALLFIQQTIRTGGSPL
jgi:hypothetical protein